MEHFLEKIHRRGFFATLTRATKLLLAFSNLASQRIVYGHGTCLEKLLGVLTLSYEPFRVDYFSENQKFTRSAFFVRKNYFLGISFLVGPIIQRNIEQFGAYHLIKRSPMFLLTFVRFHERRFCFKTSVSAESFLKMFFFE